MEGNVQLLSMHTIVSLSCNSLPKSVTLPQQEVSLHPSAGRLSNTPRLPELQSAASVNTPQLPAL